MLKNYTRRIKFIQEKEPTRSVTSFLFSCTSMMAFEMSMSIWPRTNSMLNGPSNRSRTFFIASAWNSGMKIYICCGEKQEPEREENLNWMYEVLLILHIHLEFRLLLLLQKPVCSAHIHTHTYTHTHTRSNKVTMVVTSYEWKGDVRTMSINKVTKLNRF